MIMSLKESYLGVFLFLIVSPALIFFAPVPITYTIVALLLAAYAYGMIKQMRRRCKPCGEIVSVGPFGYLKLRAGKLSCPHCGSTIKNSHRV